MHEWDVAASNPCPFCPALRRCPHDRTPDDVCLELWPLSRPRERSLVAETIEEARCKRIALADTETRRIVEAWCRGEQVSDDDYLMLRERLFTAVTEDAQAGYTYVLVNLVGPQPAVQLVDAIDYYGLTDQQAARALTIADALCFPGCVLTANEYMVKHDLAVRVPSHFQRIVCEVQKICLFALAGYPFLRLPQSKYAFRHAVEEEWRRVLRYGNGFHGFTVHPRIHIEDLVRYQQLRGGDDLVSWSISNWVIWSMTAFPNPLQTVVPKFGEKALGERLVRMYEPLVQSFARRLVRRAEAAEGERDAPRRAAAADALRALLKTAIAEYDFMYGKPRDTLLPSVGAIGPESSPQWREDLDRRFAEAGLPFRARDVVHVGFTRYVVGKFEQHLREMYPWYEPEFAPDVDWRCRLTDADDEVAQVFAAEQRKHRRRSDVSEGIPIAFEHEGVQYLYRRQMAAACGVTEEQLRNWHRSGELPDMRVRDFDPAASRAIQNRRVYPHTPKMIEEIHALRDRKQALRAESCSGMLSRKQAADALGISTRKLDQMRQAGAIATERVGHRVFIPEAEVERILAERQHAA